MGKLADKREDACSDGSGGLTSLQESKTSSVASSTSDSEESLTPSDEGTEHIKVVVGQSMLPAQIAVSTVNDIPKDAQGNFLSVGARLHGSMQCVPCKWMRSPRGCRDGILCKMCHGDHNNLTRATIRKQARLHGLQKRQLFEGAQVQSTYSSKNTFIHIKDSFTPKASQGALPNILTRSLSQDEFMPGDLQ